ncbi:hypothetical protein ACAW74_14775 [Fibrella sp. WM1]|uniref:hypothetical protein n=1 Tax=Fibrella musci TaxID=3242485 RepID=UPI003520EDC7
MSNPSRSTVYALLVAIGMLLAGMAVLVWVDGRRVRRYADEINDLHYRLDSQEIEIRRLRKQAQQGTSASLQADSLPQPDGSAKPDGWE